ncbi:hypothetical protein [Nonomuraea typhae]|uniref:hypothetical protein n=1 Tax=Nonomuraea typhae TaxID=2603600 RepID=UPI0012FAB572|nr:hypothetical protein [Nonomuraea typhae]
MSVLIWLHIAFAIFAIGPLTALTHAAPRAIRNKNTGLLTFIHRSTRLYALLALGVLIFGVAAGVMAGGGLLGKWNMTASMTLFIVAAVLIIIVERDLKIAVRVLTSESPDDDAKVQTGRIAAIAGVVSLIWLAILFLMVVPD